MEARCTCHALIVRFDRTNRPVKKQSRWEMIIRSRRRYPQSDVYSWAMTEPSPSCRKKKQALSNIQAKGYAVEKACELGEVDEGMVRKQLGFLPQNVHSIAARAVSGEPTVLRLYPLAVSLKGARAGISDRRPFPTIYWLSCPSLKAAVSQLENQGLISEWERRLQADPVILSEQQAAHKLYSEERWALLAPEDVEMIKQRGWEASYVGGVGGIVNPSNIKCMHCHLAHYLATGSNVVGRWTKEALDSELHLPADTTS